MSMVGMAVCRSTLSGELFFDQIHATDRARARLVLDDLWMHGTSPADDCVTVAAGLGWAGLGVVVAVVINSRSRCATVEDELEGDQDRKDDQGDAEQVEAKDLVVTAHAFGSSK